MLSRKLLTAGALLLLLLTSTMASNNAELPSDGYTKTVVTEAGKKFWSTKDPGQTTFSFKIGMRQVILGWDEGVMTMKVGETATFIMSPEYGYGAAGFPAWGIPKNAHLQFDIELLSAE